MSLNVITIAGNLGQDAEQKTGQNNSPYWVINIATTRKWKDKTTQEAKSETTWHRCTLYGNYQNLAPYLRKGTAVAVSGEQRNVTYDVKNAEEAVLHNGDKPIKNTLSYIVVKSISLMGGNNQQPAAQPAQQPTATPQQPAAQPMAGSQEDLPF